MLKQIILLRQDLPKKIFKSSGTIIVQACHASNAALFKHYNNTQQEIKDKYSDFNRQNIKNYVDDLYNMTTIILAIVEDDINGIMNNLEENRIGYHLWNEDNENVCIATIPIQTNYDKIEDIEYKNKVTDFMEYIKKFKLFSKKG